MVPDAVTVAASGALPSPHDTVAEYFPVPLPKLPMLAMGTGPEGTSLLKENAAGDTVNAALRVSFTAPDGYDTE